jgi:hypothetical protein
MLMTPTYATDLSAEAILAAADRAARAIPPLWPLASSVAVNPFIGQTGEPLTAAAARLRRMAGVAITMPRAWYAEQLQNGKINGADLEAAYDAAPAALRPKTFAEFIDAARSQQSHPMQFRRLRSSHAMPRCSIGQAS